MRNGKCAVEKDIHVKSFYKKVCIAKTSPIRADRESWNQATAQQAQHALQETHVGSHPCDLSFVTRKCSYGPQNLEKLKDITKRLKIDLRGSGQSDSKVMFSADLVTVKSPSFK